MENLMVDQVQVLEEEHVGEREGQKAGHGRKRMVPVDRVEFGSERETQDDCQVTAITTDKHADSPGKLWNLELRLHCIFCLRKLPESGGVGGCVKRIRKTKTEEMESEDLEGRLSEKPSADLLDAFNWTWNMLPLPENETDLFQLVTDTRKVTRFSSVPKLCRFCKGKLISVKKLLIGVSKQVAELKTEILKECVRHREPFVESLANGSTSEGTTEQTLEFLDKFWSTFGFKRKEPTATEGKEKNMEKLPKLLPFPPSELPDPPSVLPQNIGRDPLALSDTDGEESSDENPISNYDDSPRMNLLKSPPLSPENNSQNSFVTEDDNDSDPDYIKSEVEDEDDDDLSYYSSDEEKYSPEFAEQDDDCGREEKAGSKSMPPGSGSCSYTNQEHTGKSLFDTHSDKPVDKIRNVQKSCELCSEKVYLIELGTHLSNHVGPDYVLHCPSPGCNNTCVSEQSLSHHLVLRHKNQKQLRISRRTCAECGNIEKNLAELQAHLENCHETETKNHHCRIPNCSAQFTLKQSMSLHYGKHKLELKVPGAERDDGEKGSSQATRIMGVPPGSFSFTTKDYTGRPLFVTMTDPKTKQKLYTCLFPNCSRRTGAGGVQTSNMKIWRHLNIAHGVSKDSTAKVRLACDLCGQQYSEMKSMRNHMSKGHSGKPVDKIPNLQKTCDLCSEKVYRTELLAHLAKHVGLDFVLSCPSAGCKFLCTKEQTLSVHLGKFHLKSVQLRISRRTCAECGTIEKTLIGLQGHLERYHETPTKNYSCPISNCTAQFTVKQSVSLHMVQHNLRPVSKIDFQPCVQCNKKPVKIEEMAKHLKEVHGAQEIIKCAQCPFQFSGWEHLVDHMFDHRRDKLVCDICGDKGELFSRHSQLVEHYWTEHKIGKVWKCEKCSKEFLKKDSLYAHNLKMHKNSDEDFDMTALAPTKKKTFPCDQCHRILRTEDGLKGHKIRMHGADPYCCKLCGNTFTDKQPLKEHEREVHKGIAKKVEEFRCQEPGCDKVFKTKYRLQHHHSSVHLGSREFVCDVCGRAFTLSKSLSNHKEVVHLGLRNHVCDTCGEAFAYAQVLKSHKLIHTGERPHACDICGQRFRHKEVLKRHIRSHQEKGADFKPNGSMKQVRKRVQLKKRKE